MNIKNLQEALNRFDALNAQDPNQESAEGKSYPRELLHAQRLSTWIQKLEAKPSEALLLAARCQHLKRWEIPRSSFEEGRAGYLKWRKRLYQFHAEEAEKILEELGCARELIEKVKAINLKKDLKNPDTQCMEDALCLVFLEFQFSDFVKKTPAEKMPAILQKTWAKMSEKARGFALQLPFSPEELRLIQDALA